MKGKRFVVVGILMVFLIGAMGLSLVSGETVVEEDENGESYRVEQDEYELTINVEGEGTTDPGPGTYVFEEGRVVTVTATPDSGWQFVEWTGDVTGTEPEIEITMDEDKAITAVFAGGEGEAYFKVGITSYEEEVVEGDHVTVEYEVENIGGEEDTQDIGFFVYDEEGKVIFEDSESRRVSGGDEFTSEFTWDTEKGETGEFDLKVSTDDDDDEVNVTALKDADFEVEIYDYDEEVTEGDEVVVQYRVHNVGEVEGSQDVVFLVNGEEIETETGLTLDPDETTADVFRWEAEGGEHNLTVESEDDKHEVTVEVEQQEDTPGFTSAFFVIALIAAIAIYKKKKR